jgi:precorrin-6Y C5,15-methyltransferase (decarboxylating)
MPRGSVWAVEKSPLRAEQIAANRAKFGVSHVDIIEDGAMEAMKYLPSPDRIFIGGGGEGLEDIVREAKAHLRPRGLLVAALVSLDKIGRIAKLLRELGLEMSVTQVQIARSEALAAGFYLKPLNQVWLARGTLKG